MSVVFFLLPGCVATLERSVSVSVCVCTKCVCVCVCVVANLSSHQLLCRLGILVSRNEPLQHTHTRSFAFIMKYFLCIRVCAVSAPVWVTMGCLWLCLCVKKECMFVCVYLLSWCGGVYIDVFHVFVWLAFTFFRVFCLCFALVHCCRFDRVCVYVHMSECVCVFACVSVCLYVYEHEMCRGNGILILMMGWF